MPKVQTRKPATRASRTKRQVQKAIISIQSTFNNTIITCSDHNGNVVAWASAGAAGFKGARKSTPYAAQIAMIAVLDRAKSMGIQEAAVTVTGVGAGRESAVRALGNSGIEITVIRDKTPIPHNGVRPKKPRRV